MCVVEQEDRPGYAAACVTPVAENASYITNKDEKTQPATKPEIESSDNLVKDSDLENKQEETK